MPSRINLNLKFAGGLCYVIGPLMLLWRGDHPVVRFHAVQASLLALCLLVVNLSLSVLLAAIFRVSWHAGVKAEGGITWVYYAQVVLWLVMVYSGYDLAKVRLPWIGNMADRLGTRG